MRLLILELNEFNYEILKKYSNKYNFTYIKKTLKFYHSKTFTKDKYEGNNNQRGFLDPWSQWVSIHTLKSSKHHKIKNLGDIPKLKFKQFWEIKKKFNFYIWGPMNASRRNSSNVKLFFPDPWVFTEKAYPGNLNKILGPIKKIIKEREIKGILNKISFFISMILIIKNFISLSSIIKNFFKTILDFIVYRKSYVIFCNWELLCLKILLNNIRNKKNFISIYFINSLAHVQHHYWQNKKYNKEITYCLKYLDRMIEEVYKCKNFNILLMNGLSQKNSEKEKLCLYEQKNHIKFLKQLNINFLKIEKLMTNDTYIFFKNYSDTIKCKKILNSIKFQNKKIFHVQIVDDDKIFYKTNFIKKVRKDEVFSNSNIKFKFLDYFQFITLRRGIHDQVGDILSEKKLFPKKIENHKIFNYIK